MRKYILPLLITGFLLLGLYNLGNKVDQNQVLGALPVFRTEQGGTETSTSPTIWQLLIGNSDGTYNLGLLTPDSFTYQNATTDEQCLTYEATANTFEWAACGTGSGAGGQWSTSTDLLYTTQQVLIGGSATTVAGYTLEVIGSTTVSGRVRADNFLANDISIANMWNSTIDGGMDLTGDPWALGGVSLEITDGNLYFATDGDAYIYFNASAEHLSWDDATGTFVFSDDLFVGGNIAGLNISTASTTRWNTTYSTVNASSTNWDLAYGWGNHASAGYMMNFATSVFMTTWNTSTLVKYSDASTTLWDKVYSWYNATSANLTSAYTWYAASNTLIPSWTGSTSSNWNKAYTWYNASNSLIGSWTSATTSNWNWAYTWLNNTSTNINSTYAWYNASNTLIPSWTGSTSSNWNKAYTYVNASSSNWDLAFGKFGTLTNTKWCTSDGAQINCTQAAPAGTGDVAYADASTTYWDLAYNRVNSSSTKWDFAWAWATSASTYINASSSNWDLAYGWATSSMVRTASINFINNTTTAAYKRGSFRPPAAMTITEIGCYTDSGSSTLSFYEAAELTPFASSSSILNTLVCDINMATSTTFADSAIADRNIVTAMLLAISNSTNTVSWIKYVIKN